MEETLRIKEAEERVKSVQGSKDDLISDNNKMNVKIVDIQQKIATQSLEIETLKRNNDSLRNVASILMKSKFITDILTILS